MSCHSPDPPGYCSSFSPDVKFYQAFIFSVPVLFTFIILFLFYMFYLRRRSTWQSLWMRTRSLNREEHLRPSEIGLRKELREMLPVVVFKKSFSIRETQCSVCLGDYQAGDHLQRLPHCGHTFHVDCIDPWLAKNTTCPLCRLSLIPAPKAAATDSVNHEVAVHENLELYNQRNRDLEFSAPDMPTELEDIDGRSAVINIEVHEENPRA